MKATVQRRKVTVEGPLGRLEHKLEHGITGEMDDGKRQIILSARRDSKLHRMLHGLERLVSNMVIGVTGYRKELEVVGIGYNVK